MSLVAIGNNLLVTGLSLALDCACCLFCSHKPCRRNADCEKGCRCIKNKCSEGPCKSDEDCPEGYICLNGVCVPACSGEPCNTELDCHKGCDCLDGDCYPASDLVYCQKDPDDPDAKPKCKFGRPEDRSLIVGGPFASYDLCCSLGCDCNYECNPVSFVCQPWLQGAQDKDECEATCGDPNDQGRCCKSTVTYDDTGKAISYKQEGDENCPSTRAYCQNDPPCPPPCTRTFRSFNKLFDDCDLCPKNVTGPCCVDGDCVMGLDRLQCEDRGGIFKGNSWIDCETARDSDVGLAYAFACDDCNGKRDCACDVDERCEHQKCIPCGDRQFLVHSVQTRDTEIDVVERDNIEVYIRDCLPDGTPNPAARNVEVLVDGVSLGQILNEGEVTATQAGRLEIKNAMAVDYVVCIAITKEPCPGQFPPCPGCTVNEADRLVNELWGSAEYRFEPQNPALGDEFLWKACYPEALAGSTWRWMLEDVVYFETKLNPDGVIIGEYETRRVRYLLYQCQNGVFVDITDKAVTGVQGTWQDIFGVNHPVNWIDYENYTFFKVQDGNNDEGEVKMEFDPSFWTGGPLDTTRPAPVANCPENPLP